MNVIRVIHKVNVFSKNNLLRPNLIFMSRTQNELKKVIQVEIIGDLNGSKG